MPDDVNLWRIVGTLEGDMVAIKELLIEANTQRREFQTDIRTAVTEIQTLVPMINAHHDWIEGDGKRTAKRVERAGYFLAGSAVIGTSPAWIGKITAFLHAMFP